MIYFIIVVSIIVLDKILKEYFKSSVHGKHRKARPENKSMGIGPWREERERIKQKENKGEERESWETSWRHRLTPEIELLENEGAASGILAKHPKILKVISAAMLCFCALALGKERQKGKSTMAGIGYALLLGGGLSNFMDRVRTGSVTDYLRFPKFPVKKISELVFNLSDFSIFAGVFCLLFRKK